MIYLRACLASAVILATAPAGMAMTVYVPADQPTIQAGIDAASEGDTVIVADGIYTGDGNRDIDFLGKGIVVISENEAGTCIVDCGGSEEDPHRGFVFHSEEDSTSVLKGFTIRNGWSIIGGGIYCFRSSPIIMDNTITLNWADYDGGGIYCYWSSPTVVNNTITDNTSDMGYSGYGGGGGICCFYYSSPTIRDNTITGNTASGNYDAGGGGILCDGSDPIISGNTIRGNSAVEYGGAIWCYNSSPTIENNLIIANTADDGGGIACYESSPAIESNLIAGNSADENGGGIYSHSSSSPTILYNRIVGNRGRAVFCSSGSPVLSYNSITGNIGGAIQCGGSVIITNNTISNNTAADAGGIICYYSSPVITNCILWGDTQPELIGGDPVVTYSNVEGGFPGEGNLDEDPLFVNPGNMNYHLLQESPCIDTGDPETPPDPDSTRVDRGAFFYDQRALALTVVPDTTWYDKGDTLGFTVTVVSREDSVIFLQGWTEGETPSGVVLSPLLGPINWVVGAHDTLVSYITQQIPLSTLYGDSYIYRVLVGNYPDEVVSQDYFEFSIHSPDVAILVVPDTTHCYRGDSLGITVSVTNKEDTTVTFQYWTEAETPSGSLLSPLLGPVERAVAAQETVTYRVHQRIPVDIAFGGPYTYLVKAGTFPMEVTACDYFECYVVPGSRE